MKLSKVYSWLCPACMFLVFCLTACSSTALLAQRGSYLKAYHKGYFTEAEQHLNVIASQEISKHNYTESKNASWILLDRATTRFAMGKVEEAIQDYKLALESMDYYGQDLLSEQISQILLQDEIGAYQASDFEQVLTRLYFAFALFHQGDESNAYALLRQAEEYQQEKKEIYAQFPFTKNYRLANNTLSNYLFATLLEKRGDLANAKILYKQAASSLPSELQPSLDLISKSNQATVLIICHNGKAPYKISDTQPSSVASAMALEFLLADQNIDPAFSSLTGIQVPTLQYWPFSTPKTTYAAINGHFKPLFSLYNINQVAHEELEQKMPLLVAKGVARHLIRRSAVGYINERDEKMGQLADLGMWFANTQTRADTRSWTTLPASLDLARFDIEAGTHFLTLQVKEDPQSVSEKNYSLCLSPQDLCIIHIFNIQPGINQVLIPQRYLINTQGVAS